MNPVRQPKNPLLTAMRKDDGETFRRILDHQGWPTNSKWSDYELLLKAINDNKKRVAWVLLEKGARILKARQGVNNPLHEVASKCGWTDFAKVLLERGARVADWNSKGDTALHIAFVRQKSMELVDLLLKAHLCDTAPLVDVVNKDGLSFLHIACTRPNLQFVSALIEVAQVDVDVQVPVISDSYAGYTPLHFAVQFDQYDVAEHLLSRYDVDIYEQDANGSTPLHFATERGDVRMIDLILRYDDHRDDIYNRFGLSHFMAACAGSDESLVEDYLRVAAYRSWTESDTLIRSQVENQHNYSNAGYTPLHFAAQHGRINTAKLLLQLGARCCATAFDNATPFALACKRDHVDVCTLLVDRCMDVCREPPAKKRRIFGNKSCANIELVNFNGDDSRKRKVRRTGSLDSDESTLTSSSITSLSRAEVLAEPFFIDPRTICVNPRQIFEHGNEMVFHFYGDVHESSVGFEVDRSNFKQIDSGFEYPSIEIPKDFELDFYEPLDDFFSDDSLHSFDKGDCSSIDIPKDIYASCEESPYKSLSNDAGEIVQLSSFNEQVIFDDLFEKYLRNTNLSKKQDDLTADDVECVEVNSSDEQMKFDELMYKFIKDAKSSIGKQGDFDSTFVNCCDYSAEDSRILEQEEFETTGFTTADDVDTTLEVTSSSSESDILEEDSKNSCFTDDSGSTLDVMSSDYETEFSIQENVCCDHRSNLSARSSVEKEVEVEEFYEDSANNATDCDVEKYQSSDESNCSSSEEDFASQSIDSLGRSQSCDFSDLSSTSQSPVNSLNLFRFLKLFDQRHKTFDRKSSITLDFSRY